MIELLERYTLSDILIFTVFFALAVKSLVSFFSWAQQYLTRIFYKKHNRLTEKQELKHQLNNNNQMINTLKVNQQATDKILKDLSIKIDMLIDSDKDDIKSYITKEHHYFCYQMGWIDDFSLDCLERRYQHYANEGGNSFIKGFMEELRALPKQPPH